MSSEANWNALYSGKNDGSDLPSKKNKKDKGVQNV